MMTMRDCTGSLLARRAVLAVLLAAPGWAQEAGSRLEQVAQSYAARGQFMGSVLVARGEEILLNQGYGSANLEWEISNTPRTKFRLGSVTKQFTAAAILLLEEQGKLNVDDPVQKHLPDAPSAWDGITIRHLLSHTSGIPNFTSFPEYRTWQLSASTPEQSVARFRDKPLEFKPGEKWAYSNSGYLLLGYLIEKISGQSYAQFLQESIFTPLGMKDSGVDSNSEIIPRRAAGYTPSPKGPQHAGFIHMSIPHAAGALYSTTDDLLRWQRGLFGGTVLKEDSLKKMTTPVLNQYGYGVGVRTVKGRRSIEHGGGIEGFNTFLAYYPETRLTVVVLANLNGNAPQEMAGLLAAVAHGETVQLQTERKETTVAPQVLEKYVGTYELSPAFRIAVTMEGAQLMAQATGQPKFPVFAESESRFFLKVVNAQIEFFRDSAGTVTHLVLHQGGREIKGVRK
jgi:CubicO group peptidase (beta-lactamase class C family)